MCTFRYTHNITYIGFTSWIFKVGCILAEFQAKLSIHRTVAGFIHCLVIHLQHTPDIRIVLHVCIRLINSYSTTKPCTMLMYPKSKREWLLHSESLQNVYSTYSGIQNQCFCLISRHNSQLSKTLHTSSIAPFNFSRSLLALARYTSSWLRRLKLSGVNLFKMLCRYKDRMRKTERLWRATAEKQRRSIKWREEEKRVSKYAQIYMYI